MKLNILLIACMFLTASLVSAQDLSRIYIDYRVRNLNPYVDGYLDVPFSRDRGRWYHLEDANWPHYYGYGQINGDYLAL